MCGILLYDNFYCCRTSFRVEIAEPIHQAALDAKADKIRTELAQVDAVINSSRKSSNNWSRELKVLSKGSYISNHQCSKGSRQFYYLGRPMCFELL